MNHKDLQNFIKNGYDIIVCTQVATTTMNLWYGVCTIITIRNMFEDIRCPLKISEKYTICIAFYLLVHE